MPCNTITKHLRELAKTAHALEREDSPPESQEMMARLAADYESWAERIEKIQDGCPKLIAHIEQLRAARFVTKDSAQREALTAKIDYLTRRMIEVARQD